MSATAKLMLALVKAAQRGPERMPPYHFGTGYTPGPASVLKTPEDIYEVGWCDCAKALYRIFNNALEEDNGD